MFLYKYKSMKLFAVILAFFILSGCGLKSISSDGLTLKIDESELNQSMEDFPIKKNFIIANVEVNKPKIYIKKGTNRINASMNTNLSAIMLASTKASFELSGEPYFKKEDSAIYLKNVNIEELKFLNLNLDKSFINLFVSNMKPLIDTIFANIPIYKIKKDSFRGSFVKDIKIEDSELLVTFGL